MADEGTKNVTIGHAVLNLNRTLGTLLLAVLVWIALQAWDDLKGLRVQVSLLQGNDGAMAKQIKAHAQRLDTLDRRVDRLESR